MRRLVNRGHNGMTARAMTRQQVGLLVAPDLAVIAAVGAVGY